MAMVKSRSTIVDQRYSASLQVSQTINPCVQCFLPTVLRSDGKREIKIRGTYNLANLLQEVFHARQRGERFVELDSSQLTENPVHRLQRLITTQWWDNLIRNIDASGIARAAIDPKTGNTEERPPRIYIPRATPEQHAYYSKIAREKPDMRLDVQWLPEDEITADSIRSLNDRPGILALEMEEDLATKELKGLPFIVPGGRFNELYNWDSCFCAISMIESHPHVVKSILRHFIFETMHYGKILNANRSYYLGRAQPPFITDLAIRTYKATQHESGSRDLLRTAILAAMKEYNNYWMTPPRYDESSGLTRYQPTGFGIGPEVEATDFTHVLAPYAERYGLSVTDFGRAYTNKEVVEPELDTFFLHDRALRESGHDTTNRLESVCADLGTIDLNCLLYRYETDIADTIRTVFDDHLEVPAAFCAPGQVADHVESSATWDRAAKKRKQRIDKYCWNELEGSYFDYNTVTKEQTDFEYVTCLWPLWCGLASPHQAALLVEKALPKFECVGGLSTGTEISRGPISAKNPPKQWDYPYGWAPHQILAWDGLKRYGYHQEAERLIYKWLHMMTRIFVDYNGSVVEKYDVTQLKASHKVDAEYGNQGLDFKYAPEEGYVSSQLEIYIGC